MRICAGRSRALDRHGLVSLKADNLLAPPGDKIRLNGLGILQVQKRAVRMGRDPARRNKIKASKKIAFRPAKELKEAGVGRRSTTIYQPTAALFANDGSRRFDEGDRTVRRYDPPTNDGS